MKQSPLKIVGILSIVAGALLLIAGVIGWVTVASQLADAKIVVPKDAKSFAGAKVVDPFSALAQANVIEEHTMKATGNRTYAELGADVQKAKDAGDKAKADTLQKQRDTAALASFLRASLFTSVLAFGVSALAMGLGVMFGLYGWLLMAFAKRAEPAVAAAPAAPAVEVEKPTVD